MSFCVKICKLIGKYFSEEDRLRMGISYHGSFTLVFSKEEAKKLKPKIINFIRECLRNGIVPYMTVLTDIHLGLVAGCYEITKDIDIKDNLLLHLKYVYRFDLIDDGIGIFILDRETQEVKREFYLSYPMLSHSALRKILKDDSLVGKVVELIKNIRYEFMRRRDDLLRELYEKFLGRVRWIEEKISSYR